MKVPRGHKVAVLIMGGLMVTVVAAAAPLLLAENSTQTSSPDTPPVSEASGSRLGNPAGLVRGSSGEGEASESDVASSRDGAASAAEQIEGPIQVVFPDGQTAWMTAGKSVVILTPCRERLPLVAERPNGEFIAARNGPCRLRDVWTIEVE
jgi:hypothetical protein